MNQEQCCQTIMSVCEVSQERARQLLEAATGSAERAIGIHFSQREGLHVHVVTTTKDEPPNDVTSLKDDEADRKIKAVLSKTKKQEQSIQPSSSSSPSKRPIPPKNQSASSRKQRKIDTFFSSPVSSNNSKIQNGARNPKESLASLLVAESKELQSLEQVEPDFVATATRKGNSLSDADSMRFKKETQLAASILTIKEATVVSTSHTASTNRHDKATTPPSTRDELSIPYSLLACTFAQMAATTKRNVKLQSLKDLFLHIFQKCRESNHNNSETRSRGHHLLLTCVLELTLGKITISPKKNDSDASHSNSSSSSSATPTSSSYSSSQPMPLQVSGSSVSTAIQQVTGVSRKQLSESYRKMGDLGDVAAHFFVDRASTIQKFFVVSKKSSAATGSATTSTGLSVQEMHHMLTSIATVSQGKGSQATRQNLVVRLLRECRDKEEIRFVVRTLLGNMRLGATIKTVLAGLAMAVNEMDSSSASTATAAAGITGGDFESSQAANDDSPISKNDPVQRLQKIYHVCPRLKEIAHALLEGGISHAEEVCTLAVGFPVEPMLANPAQSLEQVEKFLGNNEQGIAEWKYDGVRCQAHWDGKQAKLYSRHLLDCTEQYPDAVQYMIKAKNSNVHSFILDAEIVGVVPTVEQGGTSSFRLLPFQDLSTRRSTKEKSDQVQIRVYAFDLMHLNGESLLKQPHHIRLAKLRTAFDETAGFGFAMAQSVPLMRYDESLIQSTLQKAIQEGAEGLMIKLSGKLQPEIASGQLQTTGRTYGYEAGTRSKLWLKLKKDYVSGFFDTIDVVPIGAWFGNGRKAQKGFLSPILLAVYDEDEGVFQSVSRCMSFSDDMYTAMREFYFRGTPYPGGIGIVEEKVKENGASDGGSDGPNAPSEVHSLDAELPSAFLANSTCSQESCDEDKKVEINVGEENDRVNCFPSRPPSTEVRTNENPVIWFKPKEVWEVSFADLSLSRTHTAARDHLDDAQGRGIALRFPRFKRRRPDKSIEEATTTRQLAELFAAQTKIS